MGKCCNCHIEILDETKCCPLCQSVLLPTDELENMYPDARLMMRKLLFASRVYLFVALLLQAVLFAINLTAQPQIWWSAITGLILLGGYMILRYAILGKSGHKSKIFMLALLAVLASVAGDFAIGYRGWSVDYVLPVGIVLVDGIILGCMIYNRRNWQSYIMWQLLMILCSLLPAGLFIAGLERNLSLSFLPLVFSIALFLGTMILGDRRARTELKRRFHTR